MTSVFSSARMPHHSRQEEGGEAYERGKEQKQPHISVMTAEVLLALQPKKGEVVVDATYGEGGHSRALAAAAKIKLIAIDADPVRSKASNWTSPAVIEANFADLKEVLVAQKIKTIDKALFDLGWNRGQLASGRGFSFMHDEPLVMSYGKVPRSGFTAAEALNTWSESTLADVFFGYGEERYARRIAKAVIERRKAQLFATTLELVEVVRDAVPAAYRRGRINPATKTFQALRIAVNDELGALKSGLRAAWEALSPGGRIAVITFHSIEDRIVKRYFLQLAKEEGAKIVYNPDAGGSGPRPERRGKPFWVPSAMEIKSNPASRSAKLRAIEKICKK